MHGQLSTFCGLMFISALVPSLVLLLFAGDLAMAALEGRYDA
jgi:hypothetical protein